MWGPTRRTVTFESFGVVVRVAVEGGILIRDVRAILPPGSQASSAATELDFGIRETQPERYEVTVGGRPELRDASIDVALGSLDAQIRGAVAVAAPEHIFVHAGVVAHDSRALLLPGRSFSGKTTLVAALVSAGATYYSDEYAVLDRAGSVHPYPRPLSIRSPDGLTSRNRHARELGAQTGREPATLTGVLVTSYQPEARWDPVRLSAGEATLHLLTNTVPARARPEQALHTISRAVASMSFAIRSPRGEASTVTGPILAMLVAAGDRGNHDQ